MDDMNCNNCYHLDRSKQHDLEPGEVGFCIYRNQYRKLPCKSWVSETSAELGEEEQFLLAGGIYASGQIFETAEYQRDLDEFLDELRRRDIEL